MVVFCGWVWSEFLLKGLSMKKLLLGSVLLVGLMSLAISADVGDKVYVIFGKDSSAYVESGTINRVGKTNSEVSWDYCSGCQKWIPNSNFYYSKTAADKAADKMDSEHISVGEVVGTAAVAGGLWLVWEALSD